MCVTGQQEVWSGVGDWGVGGDRWTRTPHSSPKQEPSFFFIVMLTILFLRLGQSQEGEVTSLFRQLHAQGEGGEFAGCGEVAGFSFNSM